MELLGFFIKLSFLFILLLGLTHAVYHRFLRAIHPDILSGSIVMGAGAYLWLCLPEFGLPHFIMQIAVLELAIIWVYLVLALAHRALDGHLQLKKNADRLGLGIWVVGTAIVGLLLDKVEPLLHGSILFLALVVLLLGVAYFIMIGTRVVEYVVNRKKMYVNSLVLCATITIQMSVWFEVELFQRPLPMWIYQLAILLGVLFYGAGFFGLLTYFLFTRSKYRYVCLPPRSTLIYSAAAVTGLAMLLTHAYPGWLISLIWYWTVLTFVVIEAVEINRFIFSVKKKGLVPTLFRYKNSEWIRIFSLAAFYAFALTRYHASAEHLLSSLAMVLGLYVVTILFLLQTVVTAYSLFKQNSCLAAA